MSLEHDTVDATHTLACDLAAEVADQFGRLRLRVSGTSMTPAVRPGDLLSVESAGPEQVSPGEIVVFAREGRLIAHRIVSKSRTTGQSFLVTRGDRTRRNDFPVSSDELIGRVTGIERAGVPVHARLSITQRIIARVLRFSDRATYLYLRLAAS